MIIVDINQLDYSLWSSAISCICILNFIMIDMPCMPFLTHSMINEENEKEFQFFCSSSSHTFAKLVNYFKQKYLCVKLNIIVSKGINLKYS